MTWKVRTILSLVLQHMILLNTATERGNSLIHYLSEIEDPKTLQNPVRCMGACLCYEDIHYVECVEKEYELVPYGIPEDTEILDLSGNEITRLTSTDFKDLTYLKVLNVSWNSVRSIDEGTFIGLNSITVLRLQHISLSVLEAKIFNNSLPNLKYLDLSYAGLQVIEPYAFQYLNQLETLDLKFNYLFEMQSSAFVGLKQLQYLDLSANYLSDIPMDALYPVRESLLELSLAQSSRITEIGTITPVFDLPNLHVFNLSFCRIQSFVSSSFRNMTKLNTVDLRSNYFVLLPPQIFAASTIIDTLYLNGNYFLKFPSAVLSPLSNSLSYLEMSNFGFSKIPNMTITNEEIPLLGNLKKLIMDESSLSEIGDNSFFRNLELLEILSISFSDLTTFPSALSHLTNLRVLYFRGNPILQISPGDIPPMPHLGELYVSNARNSLSVSGKPFSHLNLYILDLKSNNIVNLSSNVFVGLNNISILDVSYNNLETPDFHWFEAKQHLSEIRLLGNPWNCDCRTKDYRMWIDTEEYKLIEEADPVECSLPKSRRSVDLATISPEFLTCAEGDCSPACVCEISKKSNMGVMYVEGNSVYGQADCTMSSLTTLPQVPISTQYLNVASNQIEILRKRDFSNLPVLSVVIFRNNQISSIENETFVDLQLLMEVDLSNNLLFGDMNMTWFSASSQVVKLRLDGNQITDISPLLFRNLPKLVTLDLSLNYLKRIRNTTFLALINLEFLNLAENQIDYIEANAFSVLHSLKSLYLFSNSLKFVDGNLIEKNTYLRFLDLSYNRFDVVGKHFLNSSSLETLKLEYGYVETLSNESFSALANLQTLRLVGNYISAIEPESFMPSVEFGNVSTLVTLDLGDNSLSEVPVVALCKLTALQTLGLNDNPISDLAPASQCSDTGYLSNLKTLYLAYTSLKSIPEDSFITSLQSLEALVINNCQLQEFPSTALSHTPNLRHLVMNNNPIRLLDENMPILTKLENLELSEMRTLSEISQSAFSKYANLKSLKLSNGRIANLHSNAFLGLNNIEILELHGNLLQNPNPEWFQSFSSDGVKSITLYDNPWVCDCQAVPYLNWLEAGSHGIDEYFTSITCESPQRFKSWSLTEIATEDLTCEMSTTSTGFITTSNPTVITPSPIPQDCSRCTFENQTRLFDCSQANLTYVPSGCIPRSTEILVLSYNKISSLGNEDFRTLRNLTELVIANNVISNIDADAFTSTKLLEKILLSNNLFSQIPSESLKWLPGLKYLNLDFQQIHTINKLNYMENLNVLSLRSCSGLETNFLLISDFAFSRLLELRILDLSENLITTLSKNTLTGLEKLQQLNLTNVGLEDFPEEAMRRIPSLTDLILDSNNIRILSRSAVPILTNLLSLSMRYTGLMEISEDSFLVHCTRMKALDLSNTLLDSIPNKALQEKPYFRYLLMRHTMVSSLDQTDFSGMENTILSELDLGYSAIETIGDRTFSDLMDLNRLDLKGNRIFEISNTAFEGLDNIQYLDLSYNNLTYISCSWFFDLTPGNLQTLILSPGNSYHCSCEMIGYHEWTMSPDYILIGNVSEPVCITPSQFTEKPLSSISSEEIVQSCINEGDTALIQHCYTSTLQPLTTTSGSTRMQCSFLNVLMFYLPIYLFGLL